MKRLLHKIKAKFLTIFGDIRYSKYPPFVFYDDIDFAMKGGKIECVAEMLKRGDVLLRGYDKYLDGLFIKSSRGYSHAGIYIGNGQVVHATAPSVGKVHIIDFCQCDRLAVLRPSKGTTKAVSTAKRFLKDGIPYDFNFASGAQSLYCFELVACCYPGLSLVKKTATALFGLMRKRDKVFLSDSFLESKDFSLVFEFNPKFNIDFKKGR